MINLFKKQDREIPIFFATDDNYLPFLDVALKSLIENASQRYNYRIIVLNTGLKKEGMLKIKENENSNFKIDFFDISSYFDQVKEKLRNVFHFGLAAYYRLFIEKLFPQYSKAIYLDCDIVVLGDISELYHIDMKDNLLAGSIERYVATTKEFRLYTQTVLGIDCMNYINSGILLMNLEKIREAEIESKFLKILNDFNFKTIAPDQDYLNFLCKDRILYLPSGWNKTPLASVPVEGKLNIVHVALMKKPWQYDDVLYGEYFWQYAEKSPFYRDIVLKKQNFTEEDKKKKERANVEIVELANEITASDHTFYKKLVLNANEV